MGDRAGAAKLSDVAAFLLAIVTAFGVVFVAELGDKTQLLALGFGARHGLRTVAIGLTIGYAAAGALAALVGGVLGAALPERPIAIVAGVLFLLFAVTTAVDRSDDDPEDAPDDAPGGGEDRAASGDGERRLSRLGRRSVVASIALTIAIGEMGDKTQLATAALAARQHPVGTWIGATIGEVAAGMVGAIAGRSIGRRISADTLRWASAGLFGLFGVLLLATA